MAYNGYYSKRPQKEETWSPEDDTAGQTETFMTRNVKLITFLVCLALFLTFFGPWSVKRIREWVAQQEMEQAIAETAITYDEMLEIIQRGSMLDWSDFEGHYYEVLWETGMCIRQYTVTVEEGEGYRLMVSAASEIAPLDSVLLIRNSDHAEVELLDGDTAAAMELLR